MNLASVRSFTSKLTDQGWEGLSRERLIRLQHSYLCYLLGIIDLIAVTALEDSEDEDAMDGDESMLTDPPSSVQLKRFLGE